MHRNEFVTTLDEFLESPDVQDYGPNGLQVEGTDRIRRVVTGVTSSLALIERAIEMKADAIVVHHGIFWHHQSPVLKGAHRRRVARLLANEINLLGYHLPLDRHEQVGNNAPALRDLGLTDLEPFAQAKGSSVGWKGRFASPVPVAEFKERLQSYYASEPMAFLHGPDQIATVGLVSGGAQGELGTAIDQGLDAFLTGEVSEYNYHLAIEEGIHHFSLGHHATERVGPRCLANWIQAELGLEATFVDIPNPV